jgi:hypothetical protein
VNDQTDSLRAFAPGTCPCGIEDAEHYPFDHSRVVVPTSKNCPIHYCTGDPDCTATKHLHGCFADAGNCDRPGEHRAA